MSEELKQRIEDYKKNQAVPEGVEKVSFASLAFRASVDMISGILVGVGIGYAADRYFETFPWFLLVGFLLGCAAGFFNVFRSIKRLG